MVAIVAVRTFGIGRGVLRYAERLVGHDASFRVLDRPARRRRAPLGPPLPRWHRFTGPRRPAGTVRRRRRRSGRPLGASAAAERRHRAGHARRDRHAGGVAAGGGSRAGNVGDGRHARRAGDGCSLQQPGRRTVGAGTRRVPAATVDGARRRRRAEPLRCARPGAVEAASHRRARASRGDAHRVGRRAGQCAGHGGARCGPRRRPAGGRVGHCRRPAGRAGTGGHRAAAAGRARTDRAV